MFFRLALLHNQLAKAKQAEYTVPSVSTVSDTVSTVSTVWPFGLTCFLMFSATAQTGMRHDQSLQVSHGESP